jgi:3-dehydroquinate synthetase
MTASSLLRLDTGLAHSSPFYFGDGIAGQLAAHLAPLEADRCFLVSCPSLLRAFGGPLLDALRDGGIAVETAEIPGTEAGKTWDTLSALCETLVEQGVTRDSVLLALGGGVVGNVVGLAAGLLYRGLRYVEIPTTTMAQTDGTLSNKQAINGRAGKNMYGLYHAPAFIWADASYPRSEPDRQIRSGVVEGLKNRLITGQGSEEFDALLAHGFAGLRANLPQVLLTLIRSKLPILRRDPTEKGYAVILEYGHTFGHAVEFLSRGRLHHGEAVAIGMCIAAELAHREGLLSGEAVALHHRLLGERLGTLTALPEDIAVDDIFAIMLRDNKRNRKGLRYVLLEDIGRVANPDGDYMTAVPADRVMAVLRDFPRLSLRDLAA